MSGVAAQKPLTTNIAEGWGRRQALIGAQQAAVRRGDAEFKALGNALGASDEEPRGRAADCACGGAKQIKPTVEMTGVNG